MCYIVSRSAFVGKYVGMTSQSGSLRKKLEDLPTADNDSLLSHAFTIIPIFNSTKPNVTERASCRINQDRIPA
jgi:hypothetical protein